MKAVNVLVCAMLLAVVLSQRCQIKDDGTGCTVVAVKAYRFIEGTTSRERKANPQGNLDIDWVICILPDDKKNEGCKKTGCTVYAPDPSNAVTKDYKINVIEEGGQKFVNFYGIRGTAKFGDAVKNLADKDKPNAVSAGKYAVKPFKLPFLDLRDSVNVGMKLQSGQCDDINLIADGNTFKAGADTDNTKNSAKFCDPCTYVPETTKDGVKYIAAYWDKPDDLAVTGGVTFNADVWSTGKSSKAVTWLNGPQHRNLRAMNSI